MRKKIIIGLVAVFLMSLPCSAQETDFFTENGFKKMLCTAYCVGEVTATGVPVHEGICANNKHVGDLAVMYLEDGTYLGTFECCDTGGSEGMKKGVVIDVYRENYGRCVEWMELTRGKVYVQWIKGNG